MTAGGRRAARLGLLAALCLVAPGLAAEAPAAGPAAPPSGAGADSTFDAGTAPQPDAARWLEEVAPLITPAERAAYLALTRSYQRAAFERRFWEVRDPFPETAVNEFAEPWKERAPLARERWGSLDDARALAYAIAGDPVAQVAISCPDLLRPGEIWRFGRTGRAAGIVVVFVAEGLSPKTKHRAWRPQEGVESLVTSASAGELDADQLLQEVARDCSRGSEVASLLSVAVDWQGAMERGHMLPKTNDEWLVGFTAHSTDVPADFAALPAKLELRFPGHRGLRTMVAGAIEVDEPPAAADTSYALDGEILRDDELFDHFRYRFQTPAGERPALLFERPLRPGTYRLVVRLEDSANQRYFREERELVVPYEPDSPAAGTAVASAADRAAGGAPPAASATPAEAAGIPGGGPRGGAPLTASPGEGVPMPVEPEVHLRIGTDALVTGKLRLEADVKGEAIRSVAFALDGKPVLTKRRPPFGVELDLGRAPRLHSVSALAYDESGRELARDEQLLNGGPHRFALKLRELTSIPPAAERAELVRAVAALDVPEGEELERVEFYVNSKLYATLYQPPFEQSLPVPKGPDPAWVRAVGYLVGGGAAEDVRLVGSAEFSSAVDVDFVEIYASIEDRRGRAIEDVRPEEVTLEESGVAQKVARFELQHDLPIHAALMLDTSGSMAEELEEAERAALRFFREVLTDRDRAAVITFADQPRLAVRFTRNVDVLAGGLAGLEADGQTKIWDSLAFALHYFSGIRGKRALVLLSDGLDSGSRFAFSDVLDYAKRTGVAIYAIGINVPTSPPDAGMYLDQLAHQTGGRSYRIDRAVQLGPIYATIERELRSQYQIAYQSTNPGGEGFRPIELKVKRPGAKVTTVAGYYP